MRALPRTRAYSFSGPESAPKGERRPALDNDEAPDELETSVLISSDIERGWRRWLRGIGQRKKLQPDKTAIVEICDSVFAPFRPTTRGGAIDLRTLDYASPLDEEEYLQIVQDLKGAITKWHPRLNAAGSSGSYLMRDQHGHVQGIFKPKDEDPYGKLNPKWIKWFHRVLLSPLGFGFGRACLIPNFSYLSEAGASLLDRRLGSHIVPYTGLANFASRSFYYDYIDRHAAHRAENPKPLPEKPGSLQLFAHGFRDASEFLSEHEWPGRLPEDAINLKRHRARRRRRLSRFTRWLFFLRREDPPDDDVASIESLDAEQLKERLENQIFEWTAPLMEDFRLQLEQLIILDVLMRNTDRGLDNFMIKHCPARQAKQGEELYCPAHEHMHVVAIDNSLSFPHQHPSGWRNYSYGWLWLPASLIGQPFSKPTRDHYLPLLTSSHWWAELTRDLRVLFAVDPDFNEKQFQRQLAVLKGQAYNIVHSLSQQGDGPIELFERSKCMVYDDLTEVVDLGSPISLQTGGRYSRAPRGLTRWSSGGYVKKRDEEDPLLPRKLAIKERRVELSLPADHSVEHPKVSCMASSGQESTSAELKWDHITRPSLQRLTSANHDLVLAALGETRKTASSASSNGERRSLEWLLSNERRAVDGQREALLHEVQRGDTVAGVALQYGLSANAQAQALRQANRLWSNDSIHLRKTLYVPLDACTMPPAKELIERIEVDGDQVTIYSRALPKRLAPPVAPPPRLPSNGSVARRSTSLDLERLPTSSRTSMDSNASFYLPETNPEYTEPTSPPATLQLVEVEEPPAPLKERKMKLGLIPVPQSANQPFFRLSPSGSTTELPAGVEKNSSGSKLTKGEAVPMRPTDRQSTSGWSFDDESELAMAEQWMRRTTLKGKRA